MSTSSGLGLDLEILKRLSKDRLIRILEEAPGPKELIIDNDVMKLLDRIADAKTLRSHGVGKMYRFENIPPSYSVAQIVYLLRPTLVNIKCLANHIHHQSSLAQPQLHIHLVCAPRVMSWVNLLLEEEGLHGMVVVHEFCPEFVPLDDDLLSLDMQTFFKDAFIDGDYSSCVAIARALQTVQTLYGPFSTVLAHGRAAHALFEILEKLEDEHKSNRTPSSSANTKEGEISHLFVMDRDADFVTPLLTQLTYEGTLDEHFGIRAGVVEFPPAVAGTDYPLKLPLNSREPVFDSIRNRHFAGVAGHLVRRTRDLQGRKEATASMSPAQMKNFVNNDLRALQTQQKSLSLHISACEVITQTTRRDLEAQLTTEHSLVQGPRSLGADMCAHLDELMARQAPLHSVLRLLCLFSICREGLSPREYKSCATQLCNAYGYAHALTLLRLRNAGLLLLQEEAAPGDVLRQVASTLKVRPPGQWQALTRRLALIPQGKDPIDLHSPTHMSYVFNGAYTPLIPQLVKETLTKGVGAVSDALKLSPGSSIIRDATSGDPMKGSSPPRPRAALVLVLGGVTFAEVAALRLLGVCTSTRVLIATTSTVTGSSLVRASIST